MKTKNILKLVLFGAILSFVCGLALGGPNCFAVPAPIEETPADTTPPPEPAKPPVLAQAGNEAPIPDPSADANLGGQVGAGEAIELPNTSEGTISEDGAIISSENELVSDNM